MKLQFALTAAAALALFSGNAQAQPLTAADFEGTPSFTDTFAGGAPTGQWEIDPRNSATVGGTQTATFVTSTPGGLSTPTSTLNPVATAVDGAMMMGNNSSDAGTHFGLNYMRLINSASNGSGDSFLTLDKYRFVTRVFLLSSSDFANRWQVGPYALSRTAGLFFPAAFHNANATGGGPGFGYRAASVSSVNTNTVVFPGTASIPSSRWTLMSIMVDRTDALAANWKAAVVVDADGDGVLEESEASEYQAYTLASDVEVGPPGIFTVGEVYNNTNPLFVDWVELYLPAEPTKAEAWEMYY